jgi:type I restriction enzyme S subunit
MSKQFNRIGDYISVIDNRNSNGEIEYLMGISIDKCYIPSVANVIGTDLKNYKVIRRGQFACSLMQVSRDQRIPIAMYSEETPAIMSPAYVMFEVNKPDEILPEYMELWFRRSEFDREASFYAVGGVRGSLDWEDFCNMKLPVPSIDEQRKIVHDYQVVTERIDLLQKINDSLLNYGLLYFEKTKTDDYARGDGWENCTVRSLVERKYIKTPMDGNHGELHPKTSDYVLSGVPFIMANDLSEGFVNYSKCSFISESQSKTLRKGFSKKGDVLLTHKATIGRVAMVYDEYETIVLTPQVTYYRPINYISSVFLKYYFTSRDFQLALKAFADAGSTRSYIGIIEQLKLPVALAGKESMKRLTTVLNCIESQRFNNNCEIQRLLELRLLLINNLI